MGYLVLILALIIFVNFIGMIKGGFFKFPSPKKYNGKKSPIYELEEDYTWKIHKINKYELLYDNELELFNLLIPFYGLFKYKQYSLTDSIDISYKYLIESGMNLEQYFNHKVEKIENDKRIKEEELEKEKSIFNSYNKEFKENYL